MAGGKKRVPTDLKILRGTFREDRDGPADAQVKASGTPKPAEALDADGQRLWDRVVPPLIAAGVVGSIDSTMLTEACRWYTLYCRSRRHAGTVPARNTGAVIQANSAASQCWRIVAGILANYGLTPADRAGLKVEPPSPAPAVQPRKRS